MKDRITTEIVKTAKLCYECINVSQNIHIFITKHAKKIYERI